MSIIQYVKTDKGEFFNGLNVDEPLTTKQLVESGATIYKDVEADIRKVANLIASGSIDGVDVSPSGSKKPRYSSTIRKVHESYSRSSIA
jgi:hypothetical protein